VLVPFSLALVPVFAAVRRPSITTLALVRSVRRGRHRAAVVEGQTLAYAANHPRGKHRLLRRSHGETALAGRRGLKAPDERFLKVKGSRHGTRITETGH
jgi:hypothetical protein